MEDGARKFVVLTLGARVTAKEIMQLLQVNPQWKISGSTLRIEESALYSRAKDGNWMKELTTEVVYLERKKEKEKAAAAAEAPVV